MQAKAIRIAQSRRLKVLFAHHETMRQLGYAIHDVTAVRFLLSDF